MNLISIFILIVYAFIAGFILARITEPITVKEYFKCIKETKGWCIKIHETEAAGSTYLETRGR